LKKILYGLLGIWISLLPAQNALSGCGAGTVLYFTFKGETYLLLADHRLTGQRHRGWSGFGGLCDGEADAVAAARETEEETKGFYSRKEILAKLSSSPKIRVGDFTTFFVAVDYVPVILLNNQKPSPPSAVYAERGPYAWIPYSVVRQAFERQQAGRGHIPGKYLPPAAQTDWFFEPFLTSLRIAKKAGILSWEP
jgi:8-oxo-dGTP pyrophosphatase MutT (NUDIX family)